MYSMNKNIIYCMLTECLRSESFFVSEDIILNSKFYIFIIVTYPLNGEVDLIYTIQQSKFPVFKFSFESYMITSKSNEL